MQENKKYSKDGKRLFTPAVPDDGKYRIVFYEQMIEEYKHKIKTVDGKNSVNRTSPLSSDLEEGMSIVTGNIEVVDFEKYKSNKSTKEKLEDFEKIKKSKDDGERVG